MTARKISRNFRDRSENFAKKIFDFFRFFFFLIFLKYIFNIFFIKIKHREAAFYQYDTTPLRVEFAFRQPKRRCIIGDGNFFSYTPLFLKLLP